MFTKDQLVLCQANDAKSQHDLYDHFKAKVMGLCRRYSSGKQEAEDVFQESFVRVFQSINQLHDADKLEAWIKKIAVHTAINYYHRNKRHQHAQERNGFHHTSDDYELILSQFSDEQLVKLINDLPDGYRLVFNLHEVEGYNHAEIAEFLNISEATSRSQLSRAKQTLKSNLKALGVLKYEKSA